MSDRGNQQMNQNVKSEMKVLTKCKGGIMFTKQKQIPSSITTKYNIICTAL